MNINEKLFKTKKIVTLSTKSGSVLNSDLEKYCNIALEHGASDSRIIPSRWVRFDERARMKCRVPGCPANF